MIVTAGVDPFDSNLLYITCFFFLSFTDSHDMHILESVSHDLTYGAFMHQRRIFLSEAPGKHLHGAWVA